MKKLLLPIFLLLIFGTAFSQQGTYNPIYGKQDFRDTVKLSKLKNNAGLNYILSTDTAGRIIKVINPNGTPFCTTTLLSGSIIWVNGFNFSNTKLTYQIGCQLDTSSASNFSITAADTSDRYTIVWADTLGNLGTTDGTVGAVASIPTIDPRSQILLATYFIPANSTQPQLLSNTTVYKENIEWANYSNISGVNFAYTFNPYQGLYSIYVPSFTTPIPYAPQYFSFSDGQSHAVDTLSFLSFYVRLSAAFTNSFTISFIGPLGSINYVNISSGQYGLNGSLLSQWQPIIVPISSFTPYTTASIFSSIAFYINGSNGAMQFDNIILQSGGANLSAYGVKSINGQNGNVTSYTIINADSSYEVHIVNGVRTDSTKILKTVLTAGTNITIVKNSAGDTATISSIGGGGLVDSFWVSVVNNIHNKNAGGIVVGDSLLSFSNVFFGNSITYGYGLSPLSLRWPTVLSGWLNSTESNYGVSGRKLQQVTPGDGSMYSNIAEIPAYASSKKYIFFSFGINDAGDITNCDTATFRTQYNAVIAYAVSMGWPLQRIILNTPSYWGSSNPAIKLRVIDYKNTVTSIALVNGVRSIDIYTPMVSYGTADLLQADSIHPNSIGASLIASTIYQYLKSIDTVNNSKFKTNTEFTSEVIMSAIPTSTAGDSVVTINNGNIKKGNVYTPNYWGKSGVNIYNLNNTNVGINTTNPTSSLHNNIIDYSGIGLKMTGYAKDFSSDTGGVVIKLIHNTSANRQFNIGAYPEGDGFTFSGNNINAYNSVTSTYSDLNINTIMNTTNFGYPISSGLVSINNYTGDQNKNILKIYGVTSQVGNYVDISELGTGRQLFMIKPDATVGISTATPHSSSILDITSTTKGVLFPRLNTAQMNAVSSPYAGLIITNIDSLNRLFIYTGAGWKGLAFTSEAGGGSSGWGLTGNSGTDTTINFLGTTDDKAIMVRTNNTNRAILKNDGWLLNGFAPTGVRNVELPIKINNKTSNQPSGISFMSNGTNNEEYLMFSNPLTGYLEMGIWSNAFNQIFSSVSLRPYGGIRLGNATAATLESEQGIIALGETNPRYLNNVAISARPTYGYINSQDASLFARPLVVKASQFILDDSLISTPSSKLTVNSTTQGALFPRMTTTQKNAISSPAEGLVVYDLTLHKLCVYTGSAWETVTSLTFEWLAYLVLIPTLLFRRKKFFNTSI